MTQQSFNFGTANNGDGDNLSTAFHKADANFTDLYTQVAAKAPSGLITASGLTSPTVTLVGNSTGATAALQALTVSQVKTLLVLDQVNNTTDAAKPISTLTATALAGKEPTITAGTTSQYWRGDKSWQPLVIAQPFKFGATITANQAESNIAVQTYTIVLANSTAKSLTATTAQVIFNLNKNGTNIGNITFSAGSTTGTITVPTPANLVMAQGDYLEVIAPASVDTTLAKVAIVLRN